MTTSGVAPTATASASEDQALFVVFDERGKEGLIDETGHVVVPIEHDKVQVPTEGRVPVQRGGKWGFADTRGAIVIAPRWVSVAPFSAGLAAVVWETASYGVDDITYERLRCGYIDRAGDEVIAAAWRGACGAFGEDGLAPAEVDPADETADRAKGWAGYLDRRGAWAIAPKYKGAAPFSSGIGLVWQHGPSGERRYSWVDKTGTLKTPPSGWEVTGGFSEGLGPVRSEDSRRAGVVTPDMALAWHVAGQEILGFREGLSIVRQDKRFGFVDTRGHFIAEGRFSAADPFSGGISAVTFADTREEALIDARGNVLVRGGEGSPQSPVSRGLQLRLLHVRTIRETPEQRNVYGYRNREGKFVWVSPGAEAVLPPSFWSERYAGPPRAKQP